MDETVKPLRIPPQMPSYADKYNIFHLVQSMVTHLIIDQPDDPISYLISLLQRSSMDIPRVMLLGPPAVGKHTVAKKLSAQLRVVHVTTESLVHDQSELGMQARQYTLTGQEVPIELLVGLVQKRLNELDCFNRGWVLEGIPQTRLQALSLQQAGVIPEHVVILEAPDDVLLERSKGKLIDPLTGDVYHETFIWPSDDSIAKRLEKGRVLSEEQLLADVKRYRCECTGLTSAYQHILKTINGDQLHQDVYQQVLAFVQTRHHSRTPRILLLGPPGSGKSHQARLLSEKYKLVDVCCGQLLRSVAADGSGLGEQIQLYLEEERPVPDTLVLQVLEQRLSQMDCVCRGWILHGFPCDLQQAKSLQESQYQPNRVFLLELTDDVCVERITLRATDPVSGERFHAVTRPAPSAQVQDRLRTRPQDSTEAVTNALNQYRMHSAAFQSVYPDAVHVNADQDPHSVFETLESGLSTDMPPGDSNGSSFCRQRQDSVWTLVLFPGLHCGRDRVFCRKCFLARGVDAFAAFHGVLMMSSAEDQLCLNICSTLSSSSSASSKRKRLTTQQKWARKKQTAEKRRFSSSEDGRRHVLKQRRLQHNDIAEEEKEVQVQQTGAPPPPAAVSPQFPPADETEKKPEKKKKEKEKDGVKEMGRSSIKTSSLFKHNPDIPDIHRPLVSQVKEKIFTSDSFSDLQLHPHLVATLNKVLNVSTLTSVQKLTIPALLSGRDAVVRSQTGSGKTLSYAVPLVQSLQLVQPKVRRSDGPLAVVIVPTRELALQTFQTIQKLLKPFTWIVAGVLMGGEKRKSEKARLRKGINILISTPGRLVDHIKHTLSIAFSAVRWLVLDEADRTLDLGFEKDLTIILNSLNSTGPSRQNVLLSATLTHGVTRLADVCLKDPVSVNVSDPPSTTPLTSDLGPVSQSESFAVPEALKQFLVVVPSKIRLVCLAAFILDKCQFSHNNKLIVFVSSCEAVEFLHSLFISVLSANRKPPLDFLRLHGNMKQEERSEVFQQFSASQSGVLLCTDVAARGLDLPQVTWIVQYTPPSVAAEYVHRVGRTARIGGTGSSLLFLTPAETAFVSELANHNISLSEIKLLDILSSLMMDDTYKGRGKYHSKSSSKALEQEIRERATVLQTEFENVVHSDAQSVQNAKKALQSFLRAYTTYPAHLKHIFHIRSLHLGHTAKSFGLRDAPQGLSSAIGAHNKNKNQNRIRNPVQDQKKKLSSRTAEGKSFCPAQREFRLVHSEFASGLEGPGAKKKKKKKTMSGGEG
ncbi:hypothetical protein Q5P01_015432 [Channa striata]|uniref:ATP-dependent RNA helicase n=1 Tax=Channa striata TaxID=64152 RepID=A0AA88SGE1_CHASR|nr:hypothetical protein Q5P01_015432 [Channa striata]